MLGPGQYLTPGFQEWDGPATGWDCAVFVDPDAWNAVNKAWLPSVGTTDNTAGMDSCAMPLWYRLGGRRRDTPDPPTVPFH